jgi:hypothetical protein
MKPRILLVNPPIHDFAAYDFWLKPFGMLRVAGFLRGRAEMRLFDYLDRTRLTATEQGKLRSDEWGRGEFPSEEIDKPALFRNIPRRYRRFGLPRWQFQAFLEAEGPFDVALIQTVMTYWYPGVREVLEDLRSWSPATRTVLGGVYATLCPIHARSLGADLVIEGNRLERLWRFLGVSPDAHGAPYWEGYRSLEVGILKLAYGCPFRCTYCSVPQTEPDFLPAAQDRSLADLELLLDQGARNVAFYDDALLYRPHEVLLPFLDRVTQVCHQVQFHTPNALNARFLTPPMAERMVGAGFRTFHLGFESSAYEWQKKTGGKVYSHELVSAVQGLVEAGAERENITAYLIVGHPHADLQHVEDSMRFAHDQGIRVMLSEFSPIPGTPDGEECRRWVDLDEPLWHNKTVFPLILLGLDRVQRLKALQHELNRTLTQPAALAAGSR